jgi:hypothetical protein
MIRKWNLPLTYEPKIQPVIDGTIRQTIRSGNKFSVGDSIRFYTWKGTPYRSKRTTITDYATLTEVLPLRIYHSGIEFPSSLGGEDYAMWQDLDKLAARDGIVPPKGFVLRNVLLSKNKIPIPYGLEAQIIRW